MKKHSLLGLIASLVVALPQPGFGWGNAGHETVVAVALQMDSTLRPRLQTILKQLPSSQKWKYLKAGGLIPNNPYQTEKQDPTGWVKALRTNPEKAATFPDWARDYKQYIPQEYNKLHFYDLDYDDVNDLKFVENPNALTVLEPFETELKTASASEKAWALAWILHLVGDLHQPLHCCSRPKTSGNSDNGGNGVTYERMKLHSFWDHLPDHSAHNNPAQYANTLITDLNNSTQAEKDKFNAKASDLDPKHWIQEGHDLIFAIGYPADKKVANYDDEAHRIADAQVLLAGARLAKILERNLP